MQPSGNGTDERKSDKTALALLEWLKKTGLYGAFLKYKEKYDSFSPIIKEGNVIYPISLREGVYVRKFLREIEADETKWKEKIGLAILYEKGEVLFSAGTD